MPWAQRTGGAAKTNNRKTFRERDFIIHPILSVALCARPSLDTSYISGDARRGWPVAAIQYLTAKGRARRIIFSEAGSGNVNSTEARAPRTARRRQVDNTGRALWVAADYAINVRPMDIELAVESIAKVPGVRESGPAGRADNVGHAGNAERHVKDEPMQYCPSCSKKLQSRSCKLACPSCGYYMSCSDFY
jgi:hypothetical protein